MNEPAIRLFQRAAYLWLAGYALSLLLLGHAAWGNAPLVFFEEGSGALAAMNVWVNGLPPGMCSLTCGVVVLLSLLQIRAHSVWRGLGCWFLYGLIAQRTWLASNGGVQLMGVMLLWTALLQGGNAWAPLRTFAFWAGRLQLLLAYAAAAAHKFTGSAWLDGSAVGMVAADPGFSLGWLHGNDFILTMLTYCTLAFFVCFPLAVWWDPSRRIVLCVGVLFHLSTAVFMGIPQMGFAFIVCYAIWLNAKDADRIIALLARASRCGRSPRTPATPG